MERVGSVLMTADAANSQRVGRPRTCRGRPAVIVADDDAAVTAHHDRAASCVLACM
eukprot:SAG31_NODE_12734_length_920_cov_1.628502_2_plen_55_part_01